MWRKPSDGKSSSEVSPAPVAVAIQPEPTLYPTAAPAVPTQAPVFVPANEQPIAPAASGTSRINSGLKIHGEISGTSDLYIDGEMHGKIRLGNGHVAIGPNGRIQADIEARGIAIDGSVQGNLKASESVHLGPTSRLQGSVLTPRIGIDDGARLRGKVEMIRVGSPSPAPASRGADSDSEAQRPVTISAKDE